MPVEVCVTVTGSSVDDVQSQINDLRVSSSGPEAPPAAAVSPASPAAAAAASPEPTPADPSTPPTESQQPPWAPASS